MLKPKTPPTTYRIAAVSAAHFADMNHATALKITPIMVRMMCGISKPTPIAVPMAVPNSSADSGLAVETAFEALPIFAIWAIT